MQIQSSCSSSSSSKCTKVCRTCQNLSLASCHSNLDICFWYALPVPRLLSWGLRLLLVELESSWLSNPQTAAYLPHLRRKRSHEENQTDRTPSSNLKRCSKILVSRCGAKLPFQSKRKFSMPSKLRALERSPVTYRHWKS